jgi:hypothetical protein
MTLVDSLTKSKIANYFTAIYFPSLIFSKIGSIFRSPSSLNLSGSPEVSFTINFASSKLARIVVRLESADKS